MIQGRFDRSGTQEGSFKQKDETPSFAANPAKRPTHKFTGFVNDQEQAMSDILLHAMSSSFQGKLKLIEKFLAPEATPDDLNEREKRAQQVVATCAKYNKASWTVVDETKRPNSSLPAPEGVWGQVRFERPATKVRKHNTDRSEGFGFAEEREHYTYSMVLTLNRQGHKAIEIPLINEKEKQLALNAISQANQNTSAESY